MPQQFGPMPVQDDPLKLLIKAMKQVLWYSSFPAYLAMLIVSLGILIASFPWALDWMGSSGAELTIFVAIVPAPVGFYAGGIAIQAWFTFVVVVVLLSFSGSIYGLIASLKSGAGERARKREDSGIELTAKLFMATVFFLFFYQLILSLFRVEPVSPDFDSMARAHLIYGLVNASVNEEIITRVLLLGIPLFFIELGRVKRPLWRYVLGGGFSVNVLTVLLIVFSSVMFSLAHFIGGGWDPFKFPGTFLSGLVMGYLFVKKGLFASIIFHFTTNFFFISLDLWPDNNMILSVLVMVWLLMAAAGAYFFVHYAKGAFVWLQSVGDSVEERERLRQQPPVFDESMGTGYTCKNCGGFEAKYEEHALVCVRCGYLLKVENAQPFKAEMNRPG